MYCLRQGIFAVAVASLVWTSSGRLHATSFEGTLAATDPESVRKEEAPKGANLERKKTLEGAAKEGDAETKGGEGSNDELVKGAISQTASVMCLGFVFMIMALFHFLNYPDADVRYYTEYTLGLSISIFAAVLMFDALDNCVCVYLVEGLGLGDNLKVLIQFCQLLVCFAVLQVVLARNSGAVDEAEAPAPWEAKPGEKEAVEKLWRDRQVSLYCWAGLLAHIAAFAGIAVLETLLEMPLFRRSRLHVLLLLPLAGVVVLALSLIARKIRLRVSMSDDNKISFSELIWIVKSTEAENDFAGLISGWLFAKLLHFWITGSAESPEEGGRAPGWLLEVIVMVVCCFAMVRIIPFIALLLKRNAGQNMNAHTHVGLRVLDMLITFACMTFSFCFLRVFEIGVEGISGGAFTSVVFKRLVMAFAVTGVSFLMIVGLDYVDDILKAQGDKHSHKALVRVIMCIGVIVGLSWERGFTMLMNPVGEALGGSQLAESMVALAICVVVVSAYWTHILPRIDSHESVVRPWEELRKELPSARVLEKEN